METSTRKPILTRMVSLARFRRSIRSREWRLGRRNPKPGQIILTTTDRLKIMTRIPRLSRSERFPTHTRLSSLASISSFPRNTILNRSGFTTRRTRQTRMIILSRRRRLNRGYG